MHNQRKRNLIDFNFSIISGSSKRNFERVHYRTVFLLAMTLGEHICTTQCLLAHIGQQGSYFNTFPKFSRFDFDSHLLSSFLVSSSLNATERLFQLTRVASNFSSEEKMFPSFPIPRVPRRSSKGNYQSDS